MHFQLYEDSAKEIWDEFVRASKNGTFLFLRDYMDYHRDRFLDHSLMVRDEKGALVALMAAHRSGDVLVSHGGLTYGGFILGEDMTLPRSMQMFSEWVRYLSSQGFTRCIYKTIPHIYHRLPADEDRYCLFRSRAVLYRIDVLTVIDYRSQPKYQERRSRSVRRALRHNLKVAQTDDFEQFWEILECNLQTRHGLKPVHKTDEIKLLASRFPHQIQLYGCFDDGRMQAGAVVYQTQNVCHVQYNAASPDGKEIGAQDLLMDFLIKTFSKSHHFFDFGVSTEREGQYLNSGLDEYKEGFGGRTVVHDFYELNILKD